jgi:hypothetical protein
MSQDSLTYQITSDDKIVITVSHTEHVRTGWSYIEGVPTPLSRSEANRDTCSCTPRRSLKRTDPFVPRKCNAIAFAKRRTVHFREGLRSSVACTLLAVHTKWAIFWTVIFRSHSLVTEGRLSRPPRSLHLYILAFFLREYIIKIFMLRKYMIIMIWSITWLNMCF